MYAVGVGNAVEDELKEIASEPTTEHYFYTADFKTMTQIAKKLQINICQGHPALLTTHTRNHPYDYSFFYELIYSVPTDEDPCECDSLVKFQKKVEDAIQALTKKHILYALCFCDAADHIFCPSALLSSLLPSLTQAN